jgi:hypothetical protein
MLDESAQLNGVINEKGYVWIRAERGGGGGVIGWGDKRKRGFEWLGNINEINFLMG